MILAIGAVFKAHQPFLWSIDVVIKDGTDLQAPSVPARILFYSVSGDGNYVATLSTKDMTLQLDIWNLEAQRTDADIEGRAPFLPKPCGQYRTNILEPVGDDTCKICECICIIAVIVEIPN